MIQVSDIKKNSDLSSSKTKKNVGGESFSSYLKDVSKPSESFVSGTSSISVADAIFAAQMVGSEEEREIKKQMVKRGFSLLEKLEEIRDGLLLGSISREKLIEISRFVKDRRFNTADEQLMEIIAEIELRIEVELAKLTK